VIPVVLAAAFVFAGARKPTLVVRVDTLYCDRSIDAFSDGTVTVTRNGRAVKSRLSAEQLGALRHILASPPDYRSWRSGITPGFRAVVLSTRRNGRTDKVPVYLPCRSLSATESSVEHAAGIRYGTDILTTLQQPGLLDGCACESGQ
jgi:hypothetical protein